MSSKVKLKVYVNEDDALLFWSIAKKIDNCRGFAIARIKKDSKGKKTQEYLFNRIGFENEKVAAKAQESQKAITKLSTEWPFQRFSWTDHEVNKGDTVSYWIIPMIRNNKGGKLVPLEALASDWSTEKTLGMTSGLFKPFFNRGFVMSQFMARYLAQRKLSLKKFKETIKDKDDKTIRKFLSGDLRVALLDQLKTALKEGTEIYAALFELGDEELIEALCALGKRAHLVLANGSVKKKTDDANNDARQRLLEKHVDVQFNDRFIAPSALGHNKFLVRMDKNKPLVAWTGSTNWASTGLCTQVNNGLLIEDPAIARIYFDQWKLLRKAGSIFPKSLSSENSKPKIVGKDIHGNVRSIVWFTRTNKGVDLDALRTEVRKAREGIIFLMFMPGSKGLFSTVVERSVEPNLYVCGVVSELPKGSGDESEVDVNLINGKKRIPFHLDIIRPEGIKYPFANFAAEVTHKQFIANIGHAIIHSKVLVIDPFSSDPVVITGSHNFSVSASAKNDENFIIIKGDRELAEAYAVNILGAYAHYRWRAYLSQVKKPFNGLRDNDTWQKQSALEQRELQFWGV